MAELSALEMISVLTSEDNNCLLFLNNFAERRSKPGQRHDMQLARYDNDQLVSSLFTVKEDNPGFFCLVWRETGKEVFLDVAGLVVGLQLPPVNNKVRSEEPRNLSPPIGTTCTIQAETRFLTPTDQTFFHDSPLSSEIDPQHVLQNIVNGGRYRFTTDNVVTCEELFVHHINETVELFPSTPAKFRIGQLVEASLSFRTVHVGRRKIFLTRLDSLLLVNRLGTGLIDTFVRNRSKTAETTRNTESAVLGKRERIADDLVGPMAKKVKDNIVGFAALPGDVVGSELDLEPSEDDLMVTGM